MPKISACIITYNHEIYIRDCIEAALMQKVSSDYDIIIGDDFSNDATSKICKEYAEKHPHLIKYNRRSKNLGMIGNWVKTINECNGKYIALCEGDDYWTDPLKLQKQVDFLEANEDYVACFHDVNILETSGELVEDYITQVPINHETIEDLARDGNYIHTPSIVFRNVIKSFPDDMKHSPIGDFFLYMLLAEHGKFKYLNDTMAVYRNGVGVWGGQTINYKQINSRFTIFLLWKYFSQRDKRIAIQLFDRIGIFDVANKYESYELFNKSIRHLSEKSAYFSFLDSINETRLKLIQKASTDAVNKHMKQATIPYLFKMIMYKLGIVKLRDKMLFKKSND